MSISHNKPLFLSNGTQVAYFKHTRKGNIQVVVPDSDPIGAADPKRIFCPDGSHYKNALGGITLSNTKPSAATATEATPGAVDRNQPLFLSDGTPVDFVKVTSKGNIQVKIPEGHPMAASQANGRIFKAKTGAHYKGNTDLFLTNDAPSGVTADNVSSGSFQLVSGGNVIDDDIATLDEAKLMAFNEIRDNQGGAGSIQIQQLVLSTVCTVTVA